GDDAPRWAGLLEDPSAKLHLYGKREARPGRKMGHFCVLDPSLDEALRRSREIMQRLQP
ncbi:MAG: 5-(carboxyamino)imidazole ribonucleotide synthase, partial [Gammaproteobacteria bacterium]